MIHRQVSVAVDRGVSLASCSWRCRRRPGGRGFHRNVAARTKLLFSLEVPLTHRCLTGFFINDDGLIVSSAIRRARSSNRGLTANR